MTSATMTPPVLAEPGAPECGDRHPGEHVSCARPPEHKGGHVDRQLKRYWQAGEPQS